MATRTRKRCRWVTGCMVDPAANQNYVASKAIAFAVGQQVWIQGVQFKVVEVSNGRLVLEPFTVKI